VANGVGTKKNSVFTFERISLNIYFYFLKKQPAKFTRITETFVKCEKKIGFPINQDSILTSRFLER
jgi:hypothetical protein